MKNNKKSALDTVLYLMQTYLPQKNRISNSIKLKPDNRKVSITLGKWAKPYLESIKQIKSFKL